MRTLTNEAAAVSPVSHASRRGLVILSFFLFLPFASAAITTTYELNYNYTDLISGYTLSPQGTGPAFTTSYPTFAISGDGGNGSMNFSASDTAGIVNSGNLIATGAEFSTSFWFLRANNNTYSPTFMSQGNTASDRSFVLEMFSSAGNLSFLLSTTSGSGFSCGVYFPFGSVQNNVWSHLAFTKKGGSYAAYLNGVNLTGQGVEGSNCAGDFRNPTTDIFQFGRVSSGGNGFNGSMDHIMTFSHALNETEILNLYNYGSINPPLSPITSNHTYAFNTVDLFNDAALDGVNIIKDYDEEEGIACHCLSDLCLGESPAYCAAYPSWIYPDFCTTASGTCTLSYNESQGTIDWTAYKSTYQMMSGTAAPNSTTSVNMYRGVVNVTSITRLIDEAILGPSLGTWSVNTTGGKTYSGGGTTYPLNIYLANGENNLTLQYSGAGDYYDKSFTVSISAPEATTTTVDGVYDALATITTVLDFTNATVTNFTINASNTTASYAESYVTTTGTATIPMIQGLGLFLLLDATGYAYANTTIVPSNSTPAYQFRVYTTNSILVNIFDADTGFRITSENITVTISGESYEVSNTNNSGSVYFDEIPDGLYTIKLAGENYALRQYEVTVADRSTQTLNAFLSLNTQQVTFTVADYDTYSPIEGCSIGMYQLVNSSWTLIEAKNTDITGRAQLTYVPYTRYRFNVACDDYTAREFYLDPVIFDTYTVRMQSQAGIDQEPLYYGVSVLFSPSSFQNDQNVTFTIRFLSPEGRLSSYNYAIEYPGGNHSANGTNSIGELFTHDFEIADAEYPSRVTVTYTYDTTTGDPVTRTYSYLIGGTSIPGGFLGQSNWGLGVFERALIAVGVVILVAGMAMLYNPLAGGVIGLLMFGYFTYIGMLPVWSIIITVVAGFFLIVRRSGQ